jgi:dTDP-4-amino-4,6-dideoxygalactose transaminase
MVRNLETAFGALLGAGSCVAAASGTAAIHAAVAAIDPEPGEEIITSPITDMGAIAPILYQGAVPVFADVDPASCNVTAETIAAVMSPRTRAIIVTHLFGNPAEIDEIVRLGNERSVPVIEDCAQAFGATYRGRPVGTFGRIGCFSLQQGKHITCGEGGLVVTDDADLARRVRLFVNKGWGYGDPKPDHYFLALNGRLSELQGAVALAQLGKLEQGVAHRREMAKRLSAHLGGIAGLETPRSLDEAEHSYWRYALMIDSEVLRGGVGTLAAGLRGWGIPSAPRYIQKPAFGCAVIKEQRTFGRSRWPFSLARPEALDYDPARFPGTLKALERILVLPWSERLTPAQVDGLAEAISRVCIEMRSAA